MILKGFPYLVGSVWHSTNFPFGILDSRGVLQLMDGCARPLPRVGVLGVLRHHAARGMACDGFDLLLAAPGIGQLPGGRLPQSVQHAVIG